MKSILVSLLALLSVYAQAHPGHDHAHWLSEPIHVLTVLAIVAVVVTAGFAVRRRLMNKKSEEK